MQRIPEKYSPKKPLNGRSHSSGRRRVAGKDNINKTARVKNRKAPGRRRLVTRRTIAVLPTLFTLSNLLCGFGSIFLAASPYEKHLPMQWTPLTFSALFIFLGMLMDGLDGRVARLTRSTSDLGEQLDSMADMVTFGVAPAFMALQLIGVQSPFASDLGAPVFNRIAIVVACIYVACAALRLARFNIETSSSTTSDHHYFKGLPSPGAAGTVASLVLLHQHFLANYPPEHWSLSVAAVGMLAVTLLAALAMVSTFKYVHVMNRYIRGSAPFATVVEMVIACLLVFIYPQAVLAIGFVGYALSAPIIRCCKWMWPKKHGAH